MQPLIRKASLLSPLAIGLVDSKRTDLFTQDFQRNAVLHLRIVYFLGKLGWMDVFVSLAR